MTIKVFQYYIRDRNCVNAELKRKQYAELTGKRIDLLVIPPLYMLSKFKVSLREIWLTNVVLVIIWIAYGT